MTQAPIQGSIANQSLSLATINGFRVEEDADGLLGFFFNGIEIGRINQQGDASFAAVGINAGEGIKVVGDTISNTGVLSINGATGTTAITGGTGITVSGTEITNSGVTGIEANGSGTYVKGNVNFVPGAGVAITQLDQDISISITSTTGVSGVFGLDGSITVNPNTGAVYLYLNTANANTWSALQTFGNNISFGGAQLNISGLTAGEVLYYNGTNWINREVSSTALSSLNGLTGAVNIRSTTTTLDVGVSGQYIDIELNLGNANTWSALQTFGNNISFGGAQVLAGTLASGDVLYYNGTDWVNTPLGTAGVTSVRSSTGTISVASSTGAVDIEVNLGHANTWAALQTFGNNLSFGGAQVDITSLASGQVLYYNGTNWVNETPSSFGVESVNGLKGQITVTAPNNSIAIGTTGQDLNIDINTNNSNTWAGAQTFSSSTTYITNRLNVGSIYIAGSTTNIFDTANTWSALQTFGNNISFGGAPLNVSSLASGDILQYNGTDWVAVPSTTIAGAVSSVSNSDGTLTISPTTGDVVASLNLGHANTWIALQTFSGGINTYIPLPDSGSSGQWYKLGTLTIGQNGESAYVSIISNTGYNADINQNFQTFIRFKTSNGNSVNSNGFAGDSSYYNIGESKILGVAWVGNAGGVSATAYDLYIQVPAFIGGSYFNIETVGSWVTNIQTGQSSPGNDSSTVLNSTNEFYANNSLFRTQNNTLDDGSGNMTVHGNLTVGGSTTYINNNIIVSGDITIDGTISMPNLFSTAHTWTAEQTINVSAGSVGLLLPTYQSQIVIGNTSTYNPYAELNLRGSASGDYGLLLFENQGNNTAFIYSAATNLVLNAGTGGSNAGILFRNGASYNGNGTDGTTLWTMGNNGSLVGQRNTLDDGSGNMTIAGDYKYTFSGQGGSYSVYPVSGIYEIDDNAYNTNISAGNSIALGNSQLMGKSGYVLIWGTFITGGTTFGSLQVGIFDNATGQFIWGNREATYMGQSTARMYNGSNSPGTEYNGWFVAGMASTTPGHTFQFAINNPSGATIELYSYQLLMLAM